MICVIVFVGKDITKFQITMILFCSFLCIFHKSLAKYHKLSIKYVVVSKIITKFATENYKLSINNKKNLCENYSF